MKLAVLATLGLLVLAHARMAGGAEAMKDYPVRPVPFTAVHLSDGFWAPRIETNRTVTIPYCFQKCEETGRIRNFAVAGGLEKGKFEGIYFNDSDVFKVIEGAAYALQSHPDPELEKTVDVVIAKIAAAQEPDGYLYTARTLMSAEYTPPGGKERWSDIGGGHELYNVGHMYEAAVAHFMATGKRTLLDVAVKNADLVCSVFGPGKRTDTPGHEEIEIGLCKLYRATGDAKYLAMAKFFLDARGRKDNRPRLYGEYCQDHMPVTEQDQAVGHAVRAGYLYAGMADAAALTGDAAYTRAIGRLWENVVGCRLYVTGGIGASGHGEAFGKPYELPNLTAYCETCAAIANVLWNQRLFLLHGQARYVDVLERTLYNGLLSGIGMDGKLFFYPNPLESQGQHERSPWFGCACCPSNVARFVASVPGYVYAHAVDVLYVNLYAGGKGVVEMPGGKVTLTQDTRYPWDGKVTITVAPEKDGHTFALAVRIPGWARGEAVPSDLYRFSDACDARAAVAVNGQAAGDAGPDGYVRISRPWKTGDVVAVDLPMPVRRIVANEKVEDCRGKAAIQRGPLVYCAEWPDNPDGRVLNLLLEDGVKLAAADRPDLLGGVTVVTGRVAALARGKEGQGIERREQDLVAIPYYAWAHRGRGEMAVWLAREESAARPLPGPTIASTSKIKVSGGAAPESLSDQYDPKNSGDHSNRFFHWWPRKGTAEWVEYQFAAPAKVSRVEVYWFDDTGRGECRLPASWRLLYRAGGEWKPVANPSGFGCAGDKYNVTTFDAVETDGLRLEVQLPEKFSAGIHEWKVK